MGGALPVKYSEYFGAKRCESLKNENIRYDTMTKSQNSKPRTLLVTILNIIRLNVVNYRFKPKNY